MKYFNFMILIVFLGGCSPGNRFGQKIQKMVDAILMIGVIISVCFVLILVSFLIAGAITTWMHHKQPTARNRILCMSFGVINILCGAMLLVGSIGGYIEEYQKPKKKSYQKIKPGPQVDRQGRLLPPEKERPQKEPPQPKAPPVAIIFLLPFPWLAAGITGIYYARQDNIDKELPSPK